VTEIYRAIHDDWLGSFCCPNGLQEYRRRAAKMQGLCALAGPMTRQPAIQLFRREGDGLLRTKRECAKRQVRRAAAVPKIPLAATCGCVPRSLTMCWCWRQRRLSPIRFTEMQLGLLAGIWRRWNPSVQSREYLRQRVFPPRSQRVSLKKGGASGPQMVMDGMMLRRDVRFDHGGDRPGNPNIQTQVSDVTFKHYWRRFRWVWPGAPV